MKAIITRLLPVIILVSSIHLAVAAEVTNVVPRQEGNRLVFFYDIEGAFEEEFDLLFSLTFDGKKYEAGQLSVDGDVGKVKSGTGKKLSWNVLKDKPRGVRGEISWQLDIRPRQVKYDSARNRSNHHAIGPETIVLTNKNGNITFPHKKHQEMLKNDCKKCHPKGPGKIEGKNMTWGHGLCKACHSEKGAPAPTKCSGCHNK